MSSSGVRLPGGLTPKGKGRKVRMAPPRASSRAQSPASMTEDRNAPALEFSETEEEPGTHVKRGAKNVLGFNRTRSPSVASADSQSVTSEAGIDIVIGSGGGSRSSGGAAGAGVGASQGPETTTSSSTTLVVGGATAAQDVAVALNTAGVALGEVPKKMRDGMAALLDMHNSDELRFLGQSFDLPDDMTRQERMRALKEVVLTDEIQYRRVLRAIWEGIIIEYWRSLGKSIKHYRLDLRRMVWSYWLKEHMEKNQKASEFIPIYADLQDKPDRVVDEKVTTDDRVSTWLQGFNDKEQVIKDAERRLRLKKDFPALLQFFNGHANLRSYERDGRDRILADFNLTRKHLETANTRNQQLFTQLTATQKKLRETEAERKDWRGKYERTFERLTETQEDIAKLKGILGTRLADIKDENRKIRDTLKTTHDTMEHYKGIYENAIEGRRDAEARTRELEQENRSLKAEIRSWYSERAKARRQIAWLVHKSAQDDLLMDTYTTQMALLAKELEEEKQHLKDRERENWEMALMVHAESETRYAMLKNPKAFKNPPKKKKKGKKGKKGRGRSKSPKKRGKSKGRSKSKGKSKKKGGSKSKSKTRSKSPKKKKKR